MTDYEKKLPNRNDQIINIRRPTINRKVPRNEFKSIKERQESIQILICPSQCPRYLTRNHRRSSFFDYHI